MAKKKKFTVPVAFQVTQVFQMNGEIEVYAKNQDDALKIVQGMSQKEAKEAAKNGTLTPENVHDIENFFDPNAIEEAVREGKIQGFEAATNNTDNVENDDDQELEHWSSPNGCHEDCPACEQENKK